MTINSKNRRLLCQNPQCTVNLFPSRNRSLRKKALLPIRCLLYPEQSEYQEKVIFYICTKCGNYNFELFGKPLTNAKNGSPLLLQTCIIPEDFSLKFESMIQSRGSQTCIFCTRDKLVGSHQELVHQEKIIELEFKIRRIEDIDKGKAHKLTEEIKELYSTSKPVYEMTPCVYKLFVKGKPRRRYVGYLCLCCEAIYYDSSFQDIQWDDSDEELRDPYKPWRELFKEKIKCEAIFKKISNKKTNPNDEIEKQRISVWHKFKVSEPPTEDKSPKIPIITMGMHHTGEFYSFRPERISITLENLTQKQAALLIKKYGTNMQKDELQMMGL
ncbi:MAG: hypothetical protein IIC67_08485 [Thaumarchaeota archaeon]|nr:hypothetical protein [Nitrososphaerota archaeon]